MQTLPSNLSRRRFLAGLTGIAAGGALAACGGNGNAQCGGGKKGLTFLNWEQVKGNPLEQAIQAFEKESGTTGHRCSPRSPRSTTPRCAR